MEAQPFNAPKVMLVGAASRRTTHPSQRRRMASLERTEGMPQALPSRQRTD